MSKIIAIITKKLKLIGRFSVMKLRFKFFALPAAVLILLCLSCSVLAAPAKRPSVTMLSTKTCPACVQMSKVLKQIDATYKGKIGTAHIYLENNPDIAKKYNVRYVPTLIFRDADGNEIAQKVGYCSLSEVIRVFADKGINI